MEDSKNTARRQHSVALKNAVLTQCGVPGASVAQVALTHGLNANLVHKWRRQDADQPGPTRTARTTGPTHPTAADGFIPVQLTTHSTAPTADIRIELRRGVTAVNVLWPQAASADCALWLRELLR